MHWRKTVWLAAGLVTWAATMALAQSDDPFLRSLGKDQPVDRPGLARFMLRITSTLDNGRDAARDRESDDGSRNEKSGCVKLRRPETSDDRESSE